MAMAVVVAALAGGCSSDDGDVEAYCREAGAVAAENPAAVFDRYDAADPAAAKVDLDRAAQQLGLLARAAPLEIKGAVGTIAALADDLADVLITPDPQVVEASLRDFEDRFADVEDASRIVIDFTQEECGVDLDPQP
jgi:hypothetical protein